MLRMESAAHQELEELRARAYGPAADIESDPDALARLHELEARTAPTPSPLAPDPDPLDDPDLAPTDEPPGLAEEDPAAVGEPPSPPSPWHVSRRIAALWVASIVVVTVVTYVFASIPPVSTATGAHQVATLEPVAGFEMSEFFGSDEKVTGFDDFYGLTAFHAGENFFRYAPNQRCFAVGLTADLKPGQDSLTGPIYSGCGAGAFPATIQLTVDAAMPEALREEFPEGSAIQFVFDGDRVGVFSDANVG